MSNITHVTYSILGIMLFSVGVIGTVIPLIPTTPLVLAAAVCFGKSSHRLFNWCVSTRFYRNNVESLVKQRSMKLKAKIFLLSLITFLMGLSFAAMTFFHTPIVIRLILIVIWICHMLYFGFKVKIIQEI